MKTRTIILLLALLVAATGSQPAADMGDKLTLSLESVPLVKVLNMIAVQNGLNLVMSDNVKGDISVRLTNVDLKTALNSILSANGYTYVLRDNVIIVKPAADAAAGDLDTRTVLLKYLDPMTAKKALDTRKSPKGQIVVLNKSAEDNGKDQTYKANRIVITDYPSVVEDLVKIVNDMDVPERVILIDAKIIETTIDNASKLGFQWPTSLSAKITGVSDGASSSDGTTTTTASTSMAAMDLESGKWVWGKLSVSQASVVLDMLQSSGNSRLVSDPHITTIENNEATIKITTIIPVQTINRFTEAAATQDIVSFQDEEVGITLKVTPRINEGGRITLDVEPIVEDIIGYSGTAGNQKPIKASRSVKTRITVNDGETVALGGLVKEDNIIKVQKFPLLGHIPLIGAAFFTNSSKQKSTTDLIIMITPHVQQ